MNCEKCGAWSSVDETRKADRGFTLVRKRRCANGHRFTTYEVLSTVYSRVGPSRSREALVAAEARAFRARRNAQIVAACRTRSQTTVAAEFGMSQARVSRIVRAASSQATPRV